MGEKSKELKEMGNMITFFCKSEYLITLPY